MGISASSQSNSAMVATLKRNNILTSAAAAQAMKEIDRADFVLSNTPPYADCPQPIGYGATISAPHMASVHSAFCCASGSLINWHKSSGFVAGVDDVCTWGQHQGFTWVGPGQTCKYLGFHVGLEVSLRQQFEPVLASIRRKLRHWASMHLSLAGRALVVNQVLLATAWFTTSCWTLYPQALSRLWRLVRNFLWGGSDGTRDTRTRVAWRTVILPRQERGLGIIDAEMQSAALLSKLIVRGLYPGEEPWKQFMLYGLSRCVPSSGCMDAAGPWRPSFCYVFTTQSRLCTRHLSSFMYSIFRVWLTNNNYAEGFDLAYAFMSGGD
ncbi:hypothetical protein L7F22_059929 [Adiantum nelumboides]|nr:hypothetical protein [Adiantum nelumboides]